METGCGKVFYGNSFINFQRFNYEVCLLKHSHLVQSPLTRNSWVESHPGNSLKGVSQKRDTSLGESHGISKSTCVMTGNALPPNCLNLIVLGNMAIFERKQYRQPPNSALCEIDQLSLTVPISQIFWKFTFPMSQQRILPFCTKRFKMQHDTSDLLSNPFPDSDLPQAICFLLAGL